MLRKQTIVNKMTENEQKQVEENINLVHHMLKKYPWTKDDYDDYFQIGAYGLCMAVQGFDENKGFEFSTYAASWITGCVKKYSRDFGQGPIRPTRSDFTNNTKPKYLYIDGLINENGDNYGYDLLASEESKEDKIIAMLDLQKIRTNFSKRENLIINLSVAGNKQMNIAKILGISQAQVSRIKIGIRDKLKRYLNV